MINISQKIYAGWDTIPTKDDELPRGKIIPAGSSSAEKTKIKKFNTDNKVVHEYDNLPLPGFTLLGKKDRWSANTAWDIIDPRGFISDITQSNLESILKVTGITEGLIQQKCVWVREDSSSTMSLMPTSSSKFNEAIANTELIENKVKITDVEIGDTVLLQNNLQGKFMGSLSLYGTLQRVRNSSERKAMSMLRRQVIETKPGVFFCQTNTKILKIISKATDKSTREDSVKYINGLIQTSSAFFSSYPTVLTSYSHSAEQVKFVSNYAAPNVFIRLEEITPSEAKIVLQENLSLRDNGCMVLEDDLGIKYIYEYPWSSTPQTALVPSFDTGKISKISDTSITLAEAIIGRVGRFSPRTLDNFKKFYKIVKSVKDDTYI